MKNAGAMTMIQLEDWVAIPLRPIITQDDLLRYSKMLARCETQPGGNYAYGGTYVWFEKGEDATLFSLLWAR